MAAGPAVPRASADPEAPPPALERAPEGSPAAAPALAPGPTIERPPRGRVAANAPVAPVAKVTRTERAVAELPRAPDTKASPEAPATGAETAAEARPPSPPVVNRSPVSEFRPGGDSATQAAVPPAPAPRPDAGADKAAGPASPQTGTRLTLDVLVYSDVPAERLVFINGRKYVEGQTGGRGRCRADHAGGRGPAAQGKRILLRPKLNPYARPGSP